MTLYSIEESSSTSLLLEDFSHTSWYQAKEAFPTDIDPPTLFRRQKNILIFHDESTFNANDDELLQWGSPETQVFAQRGGDRA